MKNKYRITWLSLVVSAGLLGGCSGGGDSTPLAAPVTGAFVDDPVDGISYLTSSGLSGVTKDGGQYQYRPGDTVTFSLGGSTGLTLGTSVAEAVTTPFGFATDPGDPKVVAAATILQQLNDGTVPGKITIPATVNAFFGNANQSALVATLKGGLGNVSTIQGTLNAALPSILTSSNYSTITTGNATLVLASASSITPDQAVLNMQRGANLAKAGQAYCTGVAKDGYWLGVIIETVDATSDKTSCAQDPNGFERVLNISDDCSVFEQAFKDATLVEGGLSASGLITPVSATQASYQGKYPDSNGKGNDKYAITWRAGDAGLSGAIGSVVNVTGTWERNVGTQRCTGTSTGTLTKSLQLLVKSGS